MGDSGVPESGWLIVAKMHVVARKFISKLSRMMQISKINLSEQYFRNPLLKGFEFELRV